MTVIEVLKRNYDKSTQGRWDFYIDARTENPKSFTVNVEGVQILRSCHATANQALNDVCFVIAAHNFMPALLEAVDALKDCHARLELLTESGQSKMLDACAKHKAALVLEKLK